MSGKTSRQLLYCSFGYTTHDHRFIAAACHGGWAVRVLRFDGGTLELEGRPLPNGAIRQRWIGDELQLISENRSVFVEAFEKLVLEFKPDVIQAGPLHNVADIAVAGSRSVPVLATSWGSDLLLECEESKESRQIVTEALANSDRILVDCETLASKAEQLGADRSIITVIPWGIDLDQFPFSPKSEHGLPLQLISVRSLEPLYDVETLIRALPLIRSVNGEKEVHLTIAGAGSERDSLIALARDLNVENSITWLGRVVESDLAGLMENSDIYISTSPMDGTSISLLQAMAVGRLCVVADIPSNREWIREGVTGWFFESGDHMSLSNAVMSTCSHWTVMADGVEVSRESFVARANWTKNSFDYCTLLEATLS